MQLTYRPCFSQKEYIQVFDACSQNKKDPYDFVEGLVYSKETAVIMTGRMVPYNEIVKNPLGFNPIGYWWKPWFYQHVATFLEKPSVTGKTDAQIPQEYVETIPLRHYYHRHTRSIFWVCFRLWRLILKELKNIIPFSDHWLYRLLLGWMTPPRISIIKLGQTDAIRETYGTKHVAQDMLVPMKKLTESMDCMDDEFSCYPLWLCPMLLPAVDKGSPAARALVHPRFENPLDEQVSDTIPEQMFVDIGAYGAPSTPDFNVRHSLPRVESFVLHEARGFQALYADSYLSRSDFREMFDHRLYDQVRQKYRMDESFPEIYDKVSLSARR